MKRALIALIAGTILSGLAAAYASSVQAADIAPTESAATLD
jgi:uncharacterized MnhB-related membrane protein